MSKWYWIAMAPNVLWMVNILWGSLLDTLEEWERNR